MNRNVLSCALLFTTACGGSPQQPAPSTAADAVAPQAAAATPTADDPTLAARKAFNNPGGMWMPRQMSLPQHAEHLRAMGVSLPAENLTNPLAQPLNAVVSLGGCTA